MPKPEPNWQPISQLPLLAKRVGGILEDSQAQPTLFLHCTIEKKEVYP
jgi:hypothetical protein